MKVLIRFNTNYPVTSSKRWRLIVDGEEQLVDQIILLCPSATSSEIVKGELKHHISCNTEQIEYSGEHGDCIAVIK